ncbi:hypothetical protein F5B17DRAFT_397211 [Nemania serpens]|nr:hypothetical protein F5B17DRAFT_397211 [Nemania serpens]
MADLQKPTPAKRALPFKRTAKQRPPVETSPADDDGLELFSQSKNYFPTVVEDQQKRAREKAEKAEQERKERLAREQEEAEARARRARLGRERARQEAEEVDGEVEVEAKTDKGKEPAQKRRRYLLYSDDEQEGDDGEHIDRPSKSHKISTLSSPESRRGTSAPRSSGASKSARATHISKQPETSVVLLDSSDDEVPTKRGSKASITSPRIQSSRSQTQPTPLDLRQDRVKVDDSDSDLEILDDKKENNGGEEGGKEGEEEEDPSEFYIKAAMERMRKAKEARLARESSAAGDGDKNKLTTPGVDDDRGVPVSIMIAAPALPDAKPLCCTVRTAQALQIAFDTFKERQKTQTTYPHKMISELVFTWRGDRVYHTTKLETLGIRPRNSDGRLHDNKHSGRAAADGYLGSDKVYFEAWTPEDYEENQRKQERERKLRAIGEWWDQDDTADDHGDDNGGSETAAAEAKASQQEDDRVKVIFKARDMPPRNVTLRKHSTVAHMIKAFRKLAGLSEDKHVEIRWDGEVLDLETTVEEADIADMDSVEVHIR